MAAAAMALCTPTKSEAQTYTYQGNPILLLSGGNNSPGCPSSVTATAVHTAGAVGVQDSMTVGGFTVPANYEDSLTITNGVATNWQLVGSLLLPNGNPPYDVTATVSSGGDKALFDAIAWPGLNCQYQNSTPGTWTLSPTFLPVAAKTLGSQSASNVSNPNGNPAGSDPNCGCNDNNADPSKTGNLFAGDPVNPATGNLFTSKLDYTTAGPNPLQFIRYYNSLEQTAGAGAVSQMGQFWRSNFDLNLTITTTSGVPTSVLAFRPDGQGITFTKSGSTWVTDADLDYSLVQNASTWTLKGPDDTTETYNSAGKGTSIVLRNGYTQTLNYGTSNNLSGVTDSYGRSLTFGTNSNNFIGSVTTPDNTTITYGYTVGKGATPDRLTTVTYPTSPSSEMTYQYNDTYFPYALTGIQDENNNIYSSWSYDLFGRVATSQRGAGVNATTFTYSTSSTVSTTVTNPFGVNIVYSYTTLEGVPKLTTLIRDTSPSVSRNFGYDTNGYLNSKTDWDNHTTTLVNNAQGNPTTINYAVGSPVAFTQTISYDPTWIRLPHQVVSPGLTITYGYDPSGNPLTETDLDTTTTTIPYSTNGQTRVTTFTWSSTGQEQSVQLPRTDAAVKYQFGYDSTGALTTFTDPLSHVTKVTSHTGGGRPLTIVDPNNVTTTLTYDGRQQLHTSTVDTSAGNFTTTWTLDPAQNLETYQAPDGSSLTFGYDTAHRLATITDIPGNKIEITLNALNNQTLVQYFNTSNVVTYEHTATFNTIGQKLTDVGGMNQTTYYTPDNQGNITYIQLPSPESYVSLTYDALNRVSTSTLTTTGATTTMTYDPFNRVLSAEDPLSHSTTNVYNGFGDEIQVASPDSGTTVFHYDPDRNLTQKLWPGSLTATYTYDAMDREKTAAYTGDTTLNVTLTYDQTGHGFGIGRLTSVTDQVGSLGLTYDERANTTKEVRTPTGAKAITTTYGFDAASHVSSITYPSTLQVIYGRDTLGRVDSVTAKEPGSNTVHNILTGITYEPFGPMSAGTYGNNVAGTYGFDLDYRPTTRQDKGTAAITNLTYNYYTTNNVSSITDAVTAANSQSFNYDSFDHLSAAYSGTGGYPTQSFSWDNNDNVTYSSGSINTTFTLAPGSNQLASITAGSTIETISTTPAGNISALTSGSTTLQGYTYNKANQLATAANGTHTASYEYDFEGRRLEGNGSVSGKSYYQYGPNNNLLENLASSGTANVDYIYLDPQAGAGAQPVGTYQKGNNTLYYAHTDRLGTPQALTDGSQRVQWSALYQPFGTLQSSTGTAIQNLRMPGQENDTDVGLYHNGFRDYAPSLTRYIQTDPIGLGGGMNTYQYVSGNPIYGTDPMGLFGPYKPRNFQLPPDLPFAVCEAGTFLCKGIYFVPQIPKPLSNYLFATCEVAGTIVCLPLDDRRLRSSGGMCVAVPEMTFMGSQPEPPVFPDSYFTRPVGQSIPIPVKVSVPSPAS